MPNYDPTVDALGFDGDPKCLVVLMTVAVVAVVVIVMVILDIQTVVVIW